MEHSPKEKIPYPKTEEKLCNGVSENCLSCVWIDSCSMVREQLSFYNLLGFKKATEKFPLIKPKIIQKEKLNEERKVENRYIDPNWDFADANIKNLTHCFHNYPAMMIPQVAGRLLDMYSKEGDVVLDPFCGSGTVLVEAKLRGLESYGIDINPLALLLSKVKTTIIDPYLLRNEFFKLVSNFYNIRPENVMPPSFYNIDFWFKPEVAVQLTALKRSIDSINERVKGIKNFFLVAFSETVREVSNTRNGEFKLYRLPEEKLKRFYPNVVKIFEQKVIRNLKGMEDYYINCKGKDKIPIILDEDTRIKTSIPASRINIIVTSPPYGDSKTTVAYGQFSRLSLQWLGFDGDSLGTDKKSLGGQDGNSLSYFGFKSEALKKTIETIASKDKKRAKEVLSFFLDLKKCFIELNRVLVPGGYICMVIGNRTVKKIQIPTDEIVRDFSEAFGMEHIQTIVRRIPNKRMPSRNSPTNVKGQTVTTMNNEYIVILRKGN